jgi:riboflavin synthase
MQGIDALVRTIQEIASGQYSNDIMALTREDQPKTVRTIAEAMGLMMVKVEAREYRLELMVKELEALNEKIKQNTIQVVSAMAHALAARDAYTEGHAARVADVACKIARQMALPQEEVEFIRLGRYPARYRENRFSGSSFRTPCQQKPFRPGQTDHPAPQHRGQNSSRSGFSGAGAGVCSLPPRTS